MPPRWLDDGRVLVAGGAGSAGPAGGRTGYLYDPLTNTWSASGGVVTGRVQAPLIKLLDGRVLFVGGISVSDNPNVLSSAEIYNPASNSWTEAAGLAQPRYGHSLAMLADGQVIVLGGARAYDYTGSNPWTQASFIRLIRELQPGYRPLDAGRRAAAARGLRCNRPPAGWQVVADGRRGGRRPGEGVGGYLAHHRKCHPAITRTLLAASA